MSVARGRDDPRRLDRHVHLECLGRDRLPVNQHAARLGHVASRVRHDLVADLDAAGAYQLLGGAPRRHARVSEVLRESQRFLRLAA